LITGDKCMLCDDVGHWRAPAKITGINRTEYQIPTSQPCWVPWWSQASYQTCQSCSVSSVACFV